MTENFHDTLSVQGWQQSFRLDSLLANYYPQASRSYFQKLIGSGHILVNGDIVKKSYKPQVDDLLEVNFSLTDEITITPENIPLDIVYEDEYLLAVNKPAAMVVHPAHGNWSNTFVNGLLYYCKELEQGDTLRPGIVHRLDKNTSGILIAAKTLTAHEKMCHLFASRQIEKTYLAICLGKPSDTTINAPIGRHPVKRKEMAILQEGGKEAITDLFCTKPGADFSLVTLKPQTGRTHQLRVHLKFINHPVLGDDIYGSISANTRYGAKRQLLHAHTIAFTHPFTRMRLTLEAPLPEDFQSFIAKIA